MGKIKFCFYLTFSLTLSALLLSGCVRQVQAQPWMPIRTGNHFGISGIALIEQQSDSVAFLVVHDNKGDADEGRLAMVRITNKNAPQYTSLNWQASPDLPKDLEALTAVPGEGESTFMASTSSGVVYHFNLGKSNNNVSILKVFNLPNISEKNNIEGFSLQEINGQLIAVWGHRGSGDKPGTLWWGLMDLETYNITTVGSLSVRVPTPGGDKVRHISDLKIDPAGILYLTAAKDNGDNGPFESAVYVAGTFSFDNNQLQFSSSSGLASLYVYDGHKIEGMELVPGGLVLGSDDENLGSSILRVERSR